MPDITPPPTFPAGQLFDLANCLGAIDTMVPPPKPKARYVFGKAVAAVTKELEPFTKARQSLLDEHVTKDEAGKPIYEQGDVAGTIKFTIIPDCAEAHALAWKELHDEPVTLTGVRQIMHAELGDCPLTVQQERVFVLCGLLDDVEPA